MSVFATVDDVKSMFRRIKIEATTGDDSQDTVVTIEEVQAWLDKEEAKLKSRISSCYNVDSIGDESKVILGDVVIWKVAQIIKGVLELTTQVSDKTQAVTNNWGKMADNLIEEICPVANCKGCKQKPIVLLPDTPLADSNPTSASLSSSSSNTPTFKKNQDNW